MEKGTYLPLAFVDLRDLGPDYAKELIDRRAEHNGSLMAELYQGIRKPHVSDSASNAGGMDTQLTYKNKSTSGMVGRSGPTAKPLRTDVPGASEGEGIEADDEGFSFGE
jgi:hypothetical protein